MGICAQNELGRLDCAHAAYIVEGIAFKNRLDGRDLLQARNLHFNWNVFEHCFASIIVSNEEAQVLVTIQSDVIVPESSFDDSNLIQINVVDAALLQTCCDTFAFRDPASLAALLKQLMFPPNCFDSKKLHILENAFNWQLHIDVTILSYGGSMLQLCSTAIFAALETLQLPNILTGVGKSVSNTSPDELAAMLNERVSRNENSSESAAAAPLMRYASLSGISFDVDKKRKPVSKLTKNVPILFQFCRVGLSFIVDPSLEEESVSEMHFVIGATTDGRILSERVNAEAPYSPKELSYLGERAMVLARELGIQLQSSNVLEATKTDSGANFAQLLA